MWIKAEPVGPPEGHRSPTGRSLSEQALNNLSPLPAEIRLRWAAKVVSDVRSACPNSYVIGVAPRAVLEGGEIRHVGERRPTVP